MIVLLKSFYCTSYNWEINSSILILFSQFTIFTLSVTEKDKEKDQSFPIRNGLSKVLKNFNP